MHTLLLSSLFAAAPTADRYGDPLPAGAIQRLGTQRLRYPRGIGDLNYLPDGRVLIAVGGDLETWDLAKGERLARQPVGEAAIVSVEPRRDGRLLLLADAAGSVMEWDPAQAKVTRSWRTGQAGLAAAHYSPDEARVLTTGADPPTLKEWELASGREMVAIKGAMHSFREAIYGPGGKTAFVDGSAGSGEILAHYDLATGQLLKAWLKDYYAHPRSLVLSADGQRVLAGTRHKATEWEIEGYKLLKEFSGHSGHAVVSVAYCQSPDELLTGSRDGSIRRWNRLTGKVLARWFPHTGHVARIRVSPDGKWVLSFGRGSVAECACADGAPRLRWERHEQSVEGAALLPDGRVVSASADGALRVWDAAVGRSLRTIPGATLGAYALAVSPDGSRAAAGCKDSLIREFSLADGRLLRELKGHRGYVRALAYTPDGGRLLSSADDGSVRVWAEDRSAPERVLEGHLGGVLALAVSRDGAHLLTGGRDATVRHWDLRAGKELRVMEGHRGWVEGVAFTSAGAVSAAQDGRLLAWDLQAGKLLREMEHGAPVLALAVTPDGTRAAAGGSGGSVTLWRLATGERLATLSGHADAVKALATDGRRLVSASEDTTLLVWGVSGA